MAAYLVGTRGTAAPCGRSRAVGDACRTRSGSSCWRPWWSARRGSSAGRGRSGGTGRGGHLDRGDRRLDAARARSGGGARACRAAATSVRTTTGMTTSTSTSTDRRTTTTTPPTRRRRRAQSRRRPPQPPAAGRVDHHLARPVRARSGRRAHPVDERAADPARLDRRGPAGLRVRAGRRVRARHGAGHGRDRAALMVFARGRLERLSTAIASAARRQTSRSWRRFSSSGSGST